MIYPSIQTYYRIHSKIYDLTRWAFLFGRKKLLNNIKGSDLPLRILDVGTGTGFNLKYLQTHFPKAGITAIDASPDMINIAKKKIIPGRNIILLNSDYSIESFEPQSFDIIICSYSLTMMNNVDNRINAMHYHLKEKGCMYAVDFHISRFRWFRNWMRQNFVDLNGHIFPRLALVFEQHKITKKSAYFGFWDYCLFEGEKIS